MDVFVVIVFIVIIAVVVSKLITSDLRHIVNLGANLLELDESTSKRFLHSLHAAKAQHLINSFNPQKGGDIQKFISFMVFYLLGSLRLNDFILLVTEIRKKGYDYKLSHEDFIEIAGYFKNSNLADFSLKKAKEYEEFVLSDRFTLVLGGAKLRDAGETSKSSNDELSEYDLGISDLNNDTSITGVYKREPRLNVSETWRRVGWSIATKSNDKFHLISLDIVPNTNLSKTFYNELFILPESDYFVFLSEEIVLTESEVASLPESCTLRVFDYDRDVLFKSNVALRYNDCDLIFMLTNNESQSNRMLKILKSSVTLFFEVIDDENILVKFELDKNRNTSAAISSIQN